MEKEVQKLCDELAGTSVSITQPKAKKTPEQEQQKRRRQIELDLPQISQENLVEHIKNVLKSKKARQRARTISSDQNELSVVFDQYVELRNRFMLSEWLFDVPKDFEKWIMIPCPKAPRNLIVAFNGTTRALSKSGFVMQEFSSFLPGGFQKDSQNLTILDCFFDSTTQIIYILDMLCWADNDYTTSMELDCRLFWLKTKLDANKSLSTRDAHNPFVFQCLPRCDCTQEKMKEMMFNTDFGFELDGCLFYYPKTFYISGPSALIGWLLPWMLPEIISVSVPSRYYYDSNKDLSRKADEKALEYIKRFENLKSKKNTHKGAPKQRQSSQTNKTISIEKQYPKR